MNFKPFLIFLCLFVFNKNQAQSFLTNRHFSLFQFQEKKDTFQYIVSDTDFSKAMPTLVFVQGSGAMPLFFYRKEKKDTLFLLPVELKKYENQCRIVFLQKKGTALLDDYDKDYFDLENMSLDFLQNADLQSRTKSINALINHLSKQKWVKKEQIYLVGHSEGYRIAAKAAAKNKKIAKTVCMSANPFNRFAQFATENRLKSARKEISDAIAKQNIDSLYQYFSDLPNIDLRGQDAKIQAFFKAEISYNYSFALDDLLKIKSPLLLTYGMADVGSLHNDLVPYFFRKEGKENLTVLSYPDLEHNYLKINDKNEITERHWQDVFDDVMKWLLRK